MRKLMTILTLAAIVVAVWLGARYFVHRGEVTATVMVRDAGSLDAGDAVVEDGVEVGRVTRVVHMSGYDAIAIRINRDHRRAVVGDSLFSVGDGELLVTNTIAVGTPVADGAILDARNERVARWLAKHGGAVAPLLARLKIGADEKLDALSADTIDRQLDEWTAKVPEWRREGSSAFDRRVAEARARVTRAADALRRNDHAAEARAVEEKFERWVHQIGK